MNILTDIVNNVNELTECTFKLEYGTCKFPG